MENSTVNANRAIALFRQRKNIEGARAFDCSGLGCYLMEVVGVVEKGFDTTADGLLKNCIKVSKNELRKGCWVFRTYSDGKAYHIGYVIDNAGNVIEAKGRDDGVICKPFEKGYWNVCGIPKYFASDMGIWTVSRNLKYTQPVMMEGEDVISVQKALRSKGFEITTLTGRYGTQTRQRVIEFQKSVGLVADGICGKNTIEKLGGIFK